MKIAYHTLGCKVNQYDTQAVRELLERNGHPTVAFQEQADVYIINTCTVTHISDRKSRQLITRARRQSPNAFIVVMGCYAQRKPDEVAGLPGVDLVMGTKDRGEILRYIQNLSQTGRTLDSVKAFSAGRNSFEELPAVSGEHTRAYLKIQDGCDMYCTYCIIPYARGPVRSREPVNIRRQMEELERRGYREIVLTGIHLMSYGKDLGNRTLLDAIAQAEGLDGICRIRLGSLEPNMLTDEIISELAGNDKICRQFHLSLQSGCDEVLKRMNRRYTTGEYAAAVKKLREAMPSCAITTDIIAGFPGETEEAFEETLAFARDMAFSRIHAFPYSKREGTKAAVMPNQIRSDIKEARVRRLLDLAREMEERYAGGLIGTIQPVLFEEMEEGRLKGYTDTYVMTRVDGVRSELGHVFPVRMTGMKNGELIGERLPS